MRLPSWTPERKWVPAPSEYTPVTYGSVYPPIYKLRDGRLIVDQCRRLDGGHDVLIFDNCDHPNIKLLPEDAPAAVRYLYQRSYQLSCFRSTDALPGIRAMDKAFSAWDRYLRDKAA